MTTSAGKELAAFGLDGGGLPGLCVNASYFLAVAHLPSVAADGCGQGFGDSAHATRDVDQSAAGQVEG